MRKINIDNKAFLYYGDCLDIMPKFKSESIDLIIADPPYGVNYSSQGGPRVSNKRKDTISSETKIIGDKDINPLWFQKSFQVLKNNAASYWFSNFKSYSEMEYYLKNNEYLLKTPLVWDKGNCGMGDLKGDYGNQIEIIFFATKNRHILFGRRDRNIFSYQRPADAYRLHPMEKPVDLLIFLIEKSSKEDNIILDPFMGSGSTGEACLKTNRRFVGIEKDKKYFDIACNRLKEISENLK